MDLGRKSNEHVRSELGERLRKLRKSRHLSQQQLAERAGLSRPTVSTIERGNDVSLDSFLSVLRSLDLLDALDSAIAEPGVSPMQELAGTSRSSRQVGPGVGSGWLWGDEREGQS